MLQKKNEGILFSAEIRVVGSYTDRLLRFTVGALIALYMARTVQVRKMTLLLVEPQIIISRGAWN